MHIHITHEQKEKRPTCEHSFVEILAFHSIMANSYNIIVNAEMKNKTSAKNEKKKNPAWHI